MDSAGRIGWRRDAVHTYLIVAALTALENVVRQALGGRSRKVPTFDSLFDPPSADDRVDAWMRAVDQEIET